MIGNGNSTADIIPVDIPTNLMIAAAWSTATKRPIGGDNTAGDKLVVYNSTTGQINRLTWGMVETYCRYSLMKNPLENIFLVPNPHFTTYK